MRTTSVVWGWTGPLVKLMCVRHHHHHHHHRYDINIYIYDVDDDVIDETNYIYIYM